MYPTGASKTHLLCLGFSPCHDAMPLCQWCHPLSVQSITFPLQSTSRSPPPTLLLRGMEYDVVVVRRYGTICCTPYTCFIACMMPILCLWSASQRRSFMQIPLPLPLPPASATSYRVSFRSHIQIESLSIATYHNLQHWPHHQRLLRLILAWLLVGNWAGRYEIVISKWEVLCGSSVLSKVWAYTGNCARGSQPWLRAHRLTHKRVRRLMLSVVPRGLSLLSKCVASSSLKLPALRRRVLYFFGGCDLATYHVMFDSQPSMIFPVGNKKYFFF
jgi:hypothetical protein